MARDEAASPFRLDGRRALITGAGGGIGQALARTFKAAGATVIGADREESLLDNVALDRRAVFDVTDREAAAAAINRLEAAGAAPDIVVSNAGRTRAETLDAVDGAVWERELAINLTGAYNVVSPALAAMARRGGGAIVFIATVNALAHYGNPAYAAAKAGLVAYAKAIAVERGAAGVRANVICPGSVRTPAWDHRLQRAPDILDRVLPHYPLGRLVTPDEVAKAALFLASDGASGITGAVLAVDAGLTAGNLRFVNDVLGRG